MAKKITLPTYQQIEAIANSGDIEQLRAINERLAKTANQRMRQLEKSGMVEDGEGTAAYNRAKYFLWQEVDYTSGGVFSRSKNLTAEQLTEQIEKELTFLRSKTSTVSGEKRRREKVFKGFTEGKAPVIDLSQLAVDVPSEYQDNKNDYFKQKFLKFLDENIWKDVKKYLYTPGDTTLLQEAGESVARGADLQDLKNLYRSYLENEISIYEMWDKWTSVK